MNWEGVERRSSCGLF